MNYADLYRKIERLETELVHARRGLIHACNALCEKGDEKTVNEALRMMAGEKEALELFDAALKAGGGKDV